VVALGVRQLSIEDLLQSPTRREFGAAPEANALLDPDALQEAALLDIRLNLVASSAWFLFDCRGALQIRAGNTAVLAVQGVRSLRWQGQSRGPRTWHAVLGWTPRIVNNGLLLRADMSPGGQLEVLGTTGEFYVGDVAGGDDPPPNFISASDAEVRAGLAQWNSGFEPIHASFFDSEAAM
jgi:hypothetical protein